MTLAGGPASGGRIVVHEDKCIGCGICLQSCPTDVLRLTTKDDRVVAHVEYPRDCCACALCEIDCPTSALEVLFAPPDHGFVSIYVQLGIDLPVPHEPAPGGGEETDDPVEHA